MPFSKIGGRGVDIVGSVTAREQLAVKKIRRPGAGVKVHTPGAKNARGSVRDGMGHVDLGTQSVSRLFFFSLSVWFFSVRPWAGRSQIFSLLCLLPLSLSLFLSHIRTMPTQNTHPTHTDQIGFGSADDANTTYRSAVGDRDWTEKDRRRCRQGIDSQGGGWMSQWTTNSETHLSSRSRLQSFLVICR